MTEIDYNVDILDVRDIIERFEAIEDDAEESATLRDFLAEIVGMGGDEQWRGDWYPITLIRDSYFETYAMELADDIHGDALNGTVWPLYCIDWERAARELQYDYTSVDFNGITYWTR